MTIIDRDDHDWAARIIDPEAFDETLFPENILTPTERAHFNKYDRTTNRELAHTKAKAIVETERERCALIADGYRENAEKINAAPGRDAACMMIATDIRNPPEQK